MNDPTNFDPNGVGLRNGNFIGLPFSEDQAKVVLLSVPWDVTVSYGAGTSDGPANILEASTQLDLFDPHVPDAWKIGLYMRPGDPKWIEKNKTLRPLAVRWIEGLEQPETSEEMRQIAQTDLDRINAACAELHDEVEQAAAQLIAQGKVVGVVGGEHSVPLGLLRALTQTQEAFGILHLDAHLDLRVAYEGFTYSHASIFYNALQMPEITRMVSVGIRDYCEAEADYVTASDGRVRVFYDHELAAAKFKGANWHALCQHIIAELPERVYISFDVDALRPELCPHTGTPVPGGLSYPEALHLLVELQRSGRRIIGFDLCETAGRPHEWDGNVAARLLYKMSNLAAITQPRS